MKLEKNIADKYLEKNSKTTCKLVLDALVSRPS